MFLLRCQSMFAKCRMPLGAGLLLGEGGAWQQAFYAQILKLGCKRWAWHDPRNLWQATKHNPKWHLSYSAQNTKPHSNMNGNSNVVSTETLGTYIFRSLYQNTVLAL